MNPRMPTEYIRGNVELVRIRDAEGRIAAEGALPYPPGVLCVVPGEVWVEQYSATSWHWKRALTRCRVSPRVAGRLQREGCGRIKRLYGYVLK
ncbi:Orn/Lys/Arg family decarboxylase [Enterobacter hormaechei]